MAAGLTLLVASRKHMDGNRYPVMARLSWR
jgi:hypothetical protein